MKCEDIQKKLEGFFRNDVNPQKKRAIQGHLSQCQNCSEELRQLAKLSEVLQTWKEIEPSPLMHENLKARVRAHELSWRKIFTYAFAKKAALRFAEVAAIVVVTLLISNWLQKPAPTIRDDLAAVNFYIKEHQGAIVQAASEELISQPGTHMYVGRDDFLYFEFIDNHPKFSRPGLILKGPVTRREIRLPKIPAISKGRFIDVSLVRNAINFDPFMPQQLPPDYMIESIRKIDKYNSLHLLYSNGEDTISLFEQPSNDKRGLSAQDFRDYAVYSNIESDHDPEGQGQTIFAWKNSALSFVLVGKVSISRMMDIVQSINGGKD